MAGVHPKITRIAVKDSFDDDDDLSDVDDEVFIRDGKSSILKIDDDSGVKRPLMAPRRKYKTHFPEPTHLPYKTLFAPFCYTLIGFAIILGIIILCVIAITQFPMPVNLFKSWFPTEKKTNINDLLVPCTSLNSSVQWTRTLSKLTSEAPLRNNDVNGDHIEDIIVGFSIGLDKADSSEFVCKLYFESSPCMGGVLALDGKNGNNIWTHWTAHAVFSVDCGLDLTKDKIKDCVIAGRGGILQAISGKDGSMIWELPPRDPTMSSQQRYYDILDVRYIADVDGDGIGDVLASHTWNSNTGAKSEIILLSGKSGNKINSLNFSENEKLFVAPQVLVHPDGETYFILVSSNQEKEGGIYMIPQSKFLKGEFQIQKLYYGPGKGVSLPPLIIDINSDGTEDIIAAVFNSTIVALDGLTFKEIWNFTISNAEVISIPVPGYYNDDKVPDFMVKHQIGPSFPVYYYTQATILNGVTGKPLLEAPMIDTMSAQMSGLSLTVDGYGNDWFLHWSANCFGKEGAKDEYQFVQSPDPDADLCKLRFNSSLVTSFLAFSQHIEPPGLSLYKSEDWKKLEFNNSIDPRKIAEEYANAQAVFSNSDDEIISNKESILPINTVNQINPKNNLENYPPEVGDFYTKSKEIKFSGNEQQNENFFNKALAEMNEDEWKENKWDNDGEIKERVQPEDDYDEDPYDDEEERLLENRQLNEIRLQRSDKSNGRFINNDTNDVENQLDPSMDYTNGQIKQANYYSSLPFNRSSNSDDNADYLNIPDIDFVDNIKEAEAIGSKKKREIEAHKNNEVQNKRIKDVAKHLIYAQRLKRKSQAITSKQVTYYKKNKQAQIKNIKRLVRKSRETANSEQVGRSGIQKQPPTGILLPSLSTEKKNSVDLIFSTYWLPSSTTPFVLLPQDLKCIKDAKEKKLNGRLSSEEKDEITKICLENRGVNYQLYQEATDKENSKISLGQMTIYRMQLQCVCPEDMLPGQKCKGISNQQSWPQHLGSSGSGYFEQLSV